MESYLHKDAINNAYGEEIEINDFPNDDKKGVPKLFAEAYSAKMNYDGVMRENTAKAYLSDKAFIPNMNIKQSIKTPLFFVKTRKKNIA